MFVPLSERIRPQDIKSVFGQRHILNKFSPLTNMISKTLTCLVLILIILNY